MSPEPYGLLVDTTRCIGCGACVLECKNIRGFPGDETETALSATAYTVIQTHGDIPVRRLCMHCVDPTCVSVCPVGALQKTDRGPVIYESGRCIGCRYCMLACPFNVPRYEWAQTVPWVRKCDMCIDRQRAGKVTACVEACPVEATIFGRRDELLAEAHRRIEENPDLYYPHVYGEHELGGTSVLFLGSVKFASLGFPNPLGTEPMPELTRKALHKIPAIVVLGGTALFAVHWITKRRELVALAEAEDAKPEAKPVEGRKERHDAA